MTLTPPRLPTPAELRALQTQMIAEEFSGRKPTSQERRTRDSFFRAFHIAVFEDQWTYHEAAPTSPTRTPGMNRDSYIIICLSPNSPFMKK